VNKTDVVREVLKDRDMAPGLQGAAYAPANIALVKYWGKSNAALNIPMTDSISVSLGSLGAHTTIRVASQNHDLVFLDGSELPAESTFYQRVKNYLNLFRSSQSHSFEVKTTSSVPVAAGLASSASGFAALVKALDQLFAWGLSGRELSILARLGSGSACRSVFEGFVWWKRGQENNGLDSFAERMDVHWPSFRIGLLELSAQKKPIGSTEAMQRTIETSRLYSAWPHQVSTDLPRMIDGLTHRDIETVGQVAEHNALSMHATMLAAWPPVLYWLPGSVEALRRVWEARQDGLCVYATMDAGPNLKLVFEKSEQAKIVALFPNLNIVDPFDLLS